MDVKIFASLDNGFDWMRERVEKVVEHHQTDLAIDVQTICEDYFLHKDTAYIWSIGRNGTHLMHIDNAEKIAAVKCNYPDNLYYEMHF